jgi:hypothetical protein
MVSGRKLPIKTSGGFAIENKAKVGRARARGTSVGPFVAPHGTRMEFRLAKPVNL